MIGDGRRDGSEEWWSFLPDAWWVILVSTVFALTSLWQGIRFRQGARPELARWYRDASHPWYIRNLAFVLLPVAATFGLWVAAAVLFLTSHPVAALLSIGLVSITGIAFFLALLWGREPPRFLKPSWLLDEESRLGPPPPTTGPARTIGRVVFAAAAVISAIVVLGPLLLVISSRFVDGTNATPVLPRSRLRVPCRRA